MTDPIRSADAVVAAVDPGLAAPAVRARDVVAVTGPPLAGTTGVVAALRDRMPDHTVVEAADLAADEAPAAVVAVVSAAAPMTASDAALIERAARHTDALIAAVTKTDAHRQWRDVLAAARDELARRSARFAQTPWVGVAAAPDLGPPQVDELVTVLRETLAAPDLVRRNRLRAWETRLQDTIGRPAGAGRRARVAELHRARDDVLSGRRAGRADRQAALRREIQQARVQLGYLARNRCTVERAELAEQAAALGRGQSGTFQARVRERMERLVAELDTETTARLDEVAARLGLAAPPAPSPPPNPQLGAPPLTARRLETQLGMLLGAGFGLGVALMVTRLITGLAPGLTAAGLAVGGAAGLALTVWVVGIRGLLHDRAVLDRWLTDVTARVRTAAEERVATRMLTAESALGAALRSVEQEESAAARARLTAIDDELRDHTLRTARAAAARERRLPALTRALEAVRNELSAARDS
jgi:hypothetical protein